MTSAWPGARRTPEAPKPEGSVVPDSGFAERVKRAEAKFKAAKAKAEAGMMGETERRIRAGIRRRTVTATEFGVIRPDGPQAYMPRNTAYRTSYR